MRKELPGFSRPHPDETNSFSIFFNKYLENGNSELDMVPMAHTGLPLLILTESLDVGTIISPFDR